MMREAAGNTKLCDHDAHRHGTDCIIIITLAKKTGIRPCASSCTTCCTILAATRFHVNRKGADHTEKVSCPRAGYRSRPTLVPTLEGVHKRRRELTPPCAAKDKDGWIYLCQLWFTQCSIKMSSSWSDEFMLLDSVHSKFKWKYVSTYVNFFFFQEMK